VGAQGRGNRRRDPHARARRRVVNGCWLASPVVYVGARAHEQRSSDGPAMHGEPAADRVRGMQHHRSIVSGLIRARTTTDR
jgi:hypothetical protein